MRVDPLKVNVFSGDRRLGSVAWREGRYVFEAAEEAFEGDAWLRDWLRRMAEETGERASPPEGFFRYVVGRTFGRTSWASYAPDEAGVEVGAADLRRLALEVVARVREHGAATPPASSARSPAV